MVKNKNKFCIVSGAVLLSGYNIFSGCSNNKVKVDVTKPDFLKDDFIGCYKENEAEEKALAASTAVSKALVGWAKNDNKSSITITINDVFEAGKQILVYLIVNPLDLTKVILQKDKAPDPKDVEKSKYIIKIDIKGPAATPTRPLFYRHSANTSNCSVTQGTK